MTPVITVEDRILAFLARSPLAAVPPKEARRAVAVSMSLFNEAIANLRDRGLIHADRVQLLPQAPRPTTIAEDAAADATRRQRNRAAAITRIGTLTPAERIATACLEQPVDVVTYVRTRWPELWTRNIAAARIAGVSPATHLFTAIEQGLAA